jgi:hypothetical protein
VNGLFTFSFLTGGITPMMLELADIVELRVACETPQGSFRFGIVAEIVSTHPNGEVQEVSLYLYDPVRKTIFLGPNWIPEYVDCDVSEMLLYKRARDDGYDPLV